MVDDRLPQTPGAPNMAAIEADRASVIDDEHPRTPVNKRRSTYREFDVRERHSMRSMWDGLLTRLPQSSPAVSSPAGAARPERSVHSSPASFTRAGALLPEQATPPLQPEHDRSMLAVVVIALAATVFALAAVVGTEVLLRALGRTGFISEFVGSATSNPGYIYDLILIAIAVLGASLGTAFLIVSAIVGVRLERRAQQTHRREETFRPAFPQQNH